jgi:hypothetical protein
MHVVNEAEAAKIFTIVSKIVLVRTEIQSIVSVNRAEILHHYHRRLTDPEAILDPYNLIPLTAYEHVLVHQGKISIEPLRRFGIPMWKVRDEYGAKFTVPISEEFVVEWNRELVKISQDRGVG